MSYAKKMKKILRSCIKQTVQSSSLFVKHPNTDFTRKRKLSFKTMLYLLTQTSYT